MTVANLDLPDAVFLDADSTIGDAIAKFQSGGYAQYPVRQADGKITGVVTKVEALKQLVKQRATMSDPVSKLVQRDLRHVSSTISLDEMSRILNRNKFALIEKTKFVTTSDLLKKISNKDSCCKPKPQESAAQEASSEGSGMMQMAAAAVVGAGLAAVGTFLAMKNKSI